MLSSAHLIFLKFPEAGKVKTRLGKEIGHDKAAELYRMLVERLLESADVQNYDVHLFVEPYDRLIEFKNWLGDGYVYHPQVGADIGEKMFNALQVSFDIGYERSVLTGTDIPELDSVIITSSLQSLENSDAVIGKACDGGYYLIGFNRDKLKMAFFLRILAGVQMLFFFGNYAYI